MFLLFNKNIKKCIAYKNLIIGSSNNQKKIFSFVCNLTYKKFFLIYKVQNNKKLIRNKTEKRKVVQDLGDLNSKIEYRLIIRVRVCGHQENITYRCILFIFIWTI